MVAHDSIIMVLAVRAWWSSDSDGCGKESFDQAILFYGNIALRTLENCRALAFH
jgi:hypothetical protein